MRAELAGFQSIFIVESCLPLRRPGLELPALRHRLEHASVVQDVTLLICDIRHALEMADPCKNGIAQPGI